MVPPYERTGRTPGQVLQVPLLGVLGALAGPAALLDDLDDVVRLPRPHIDWDF